MEEQQEDKEGNEDVRWKRGGKEKRHKEKKKEEEEESRKTTETLEKKQQYREVVRPHVKHLENTWQTCRTVQAPSAVQVLNNFTTVVQITVRDLIARQTQQ